MTPPPIHSAWKSHAEGWKDCSTGLFCQDHNLGLGLAPQQKAELWCYNAVLLDYFFLVEKSSPEAVKPKKEEKKKI